MVEKLNSIGFRFLWKVFSMLRILFLLLAVFIGGWVAWPAYSAYQIYGGMKSADEDVLRRKINWESMRTSLRPGCGDRS